MVYAAPLVKLYAGVAVSLEVQASESSARASVVDDGHAAHGLRLICRPYAYTLRPKKAFVLRCMGIYDGEKEKQLG